MRKQFNLSQKYQLQYFAEIFAPDIEEISAIAQLLPVIIHTFPINDMCTTIISL